MAPGSLIKLPAGVPLLILLVGLLLRSCLVSAQNTTINSTSMSSVTPTISMSPMSSSSMQPPTTTMSAVPSNSTWGATSNMNSTSMINCPIITCLFADCYTTYQSKINSSWCPSDTKYCQMLRPTNMCYNVTCTVSCVDMCTNASQSNCSGACCNTTACMDATFNALMMPTTTTTGAMPNMNSTSMINCPLITCNYSDCYTSYQSNMNSSWCSSDSKNCQVLRQTDMSYIVSCTVSCMDMCTNTSQNNCSSACCNSTACMDATFNAMMMPTTTTTVMPTTTPAPTTTTTTTTPATTPDNRNQCHTGVCSDTADCYKSITTAGRCTSDQKYCQLKKELIASKVKWTSGCTTNCSSETWCTPSTTACHQECCLSAKTSCLAMNGTLNVPSSATRGPRFLVDLIVLLICLLVVSGLYTI